MGISLQRPQKAINYLFIEISDFLVFHIIQYFYNIYQIVLLVIGLICLNIIIYFI